MSLPGTIVELRMLKQRLREIGPRPPWWRRAKRREWTLQCHAWLADALETRSAAALYLASQAVQLGLVAAPSHLRKP